MVIKIDDDKDLSKVKDFLIKNNIEFKIDISAYIMALKEDIEDTWDCIYDTEPPEELLEDVFFKILKNDNVYTQYDEYINKYITETLEEYNKK